MIRAFGVQNRFIEESESKVDFNQMCYYPSIIANRYEFFLKILKIQINIKIKIIVQNVIHCVLLQVVGSTFRNGRKFNYFLFCIICCIK